MNIENKAYNKWESQVSVIDLIDSDLAQRGRSDMRNKIAAMQASRSTSSYVFDVLREMSHDICNDIIEDMMNAKS